MNMDINDLMPTLQADFAALNLRHSIVKGTYPRRYTPFKPNEIKAAYIAIRKLVPQTIDYSRNEDADLKQREKRASEAFGRLKDPDSLALLQECYFDFRDRQRQDRQRVMRDNMRKHRHDLHQQKIRQRGEQLSQLTQTVPAASVRQAASFTYNLTATLPAKPEQPAAEPVAVFRTKKQRKADKKRRRELESAQRRARKTRRNAQKKAAKKEAVRIKVKQLKRMSRARIDLETKGRLPEAQVIQLGTARRERRVQRQQTAFLSAVATSLAGVLVFGIWGAVDIASHPEKIGDAVETLNIITGAPQPAPPADPGPSHWAPPRELLR